LPPDTAITEAQGARVWLNTGKNGRDGYLDFVSGLGSNLLGYSQPDFCNYVSRQLSLTGGSLSLPSVLESQVAEKLCQLLGHHIPGWSPDTISTRFAKTGSDVTTMAVRLARAVTNRPWILTFKGHYHGWHDWTIGRTSPGLGVLPIMEMGAEPYDRASWNRALEVEPNPDLGGWYDFGTVAAVILEVGITEPLPGWYDTLRDICDRSGTLLIVDEIVTGLRYGLGGACERYGIKPDLVCIGKALGNGLPISALAGRRELMDWFSRDNPVFCSSTFFGEAVGLAAADYVLSHWTQKDVDYLWTLGGKLLESDWPIVGHAPRSLFTFESEVQRAFFIQAALKAGLLINRPNFPTLAHTVEDVEYTLAAVKRIKAKWRATEPEEAARQVEGKLPRILFKER
jgi:glutamate-1-semialdehyde aminotransferase